MLTADMMDYKSADARIRGCENSTSLSDCFVSTNDGMQASDIVTLNKMISLGAIYAAS